jgi:hypothetical protein
MGEGQRIVQLVLKAVGLATSLNSPVPSLVLVGLTDLLPGEGQDTKESIPA